MYSLHLVKADKKNLQEVRALIFSLFKTLHMSDFNSFHPSVGTSDSFWDPSLRMSDASKVDDASAVSAGFKFSLALTESAWEKKKGGRVTGEIVVIAFKLTSLGDKRT